MEIIEIEEVALLLTDAFETNPAYSLIFNRTGNLREGLFWLFKTNLFLLNCRQTLTTVLKEKDSGKIIGAFSLIPPEGVKNTFFDYLHIGIFQFILKFGIDPLRKMLDMDSLNKKTLKNSIGIEEYYYLSMVALKEEVRGKGIGSFVIKKCLDELSEKNKDGHLVALTTQLPQNVVFYSRLRFEITGEGNLNYKGYEYYNWNMKFSFM